MYTFNVIPKLFGLFYTYVYLKSSLQDAVGILRNITMKTSFIKRPTEDWIHSSNQQQTTDLNPKQLTLDIETNNFISVSMAKHTSYSTLCGSNLSEL